MNGISKFVVRLIEAYQNRGGGQQFFNIDCMFLPSCSEYTKQAIVRFGLVRGIQIGWNRICRCQGSDSMQKVRDPIPDVVAAGDLIVFKLSQEAVDRREEELRTQIRNLSDDERQAFYRLAKKRLRDPDTYATLNYFLVGLHHFYLGDWTRGAIAIGAFLGGLVLLVVALGMESGWLAVVGAIAVIGTLATEFFTLFRSSIIVQNYNNQVMADVLTKIRPS